MVVQPVGGDCAPIPVRIHLAASILADTAALGGGEIRAAGFGTIDAARSVARIGARRWNAECREQSCRRG